MPLEPGDALILTKPLGTGALLAAWMRGVCRADWFAAVTGTSFSALLNATVSFANIAGF